MSDWILQHAKHLAAEAAANDRLSQVYFEVWRTYPIQRFVHAFEMKKLEQLKCSGTILVVGAGGGRELPTLLKTADCIVALDLSEKMIELGRRENPDARISWVRADGLRLPFRSGQFAALTCLGPVINYFFDRAQAIAEFRRVLQSGGIIYASSFNADHPTEQQLRVITPRIRQPLTATELREEIENAGFRDADVHGIRYLADLVPPAWNLPGAAPEERAALEKLMEFEQLLTACEHTMPPKLLYAIARSP